MEKPADNAYPIHDLLRRRWSPRAFSERPVEPEKLRSLFEAARWAPSSDNEQPWSFVMATKDEEEAYARLYNCLKEGNKRWAFRAPVLALSVARLNFEDDGKPNRHAFHDTGMAVFSLVIQATALGLIVHQMAGYDVEKARKELKIPAGHDPVAMMAIGYPGDPDHLPEPYRTREFNPRERKSVSEFLFGGMWGNASPIVSE
jgi:nitroreductase